MVEGYTMLTLSIPGEKLHMLIMNSHYPQKLIGEDDVHCK
jgi:hypothetical protein